MEKTGCMILATERKLALCPDLALKINGLKTKQVDRKDYLDFGSTKNLSMTDKYLKCKIRSDVTVNFRNQNSTFSSSGGIEKLITHLSNNS